MSKENEDIAKKVERARGCIHQLLGQSYFTGDAPIDDHASVKERYRLDSIGFVKIIHSLEMVLGIRFLAKEVNSQNFCTIDCILKLVVKKLQAEGK
jgi:acyl carrier protein